MQEKSIAHYHVVERLGQGSTGVVYKAHDTRADRFVALKVLHPEKVRRFVQEAKAASALNHPNIASIYDVGSAGGVDYIAMELVEGQTLTDVIGQKGLASDLVLKYGIQVADALETAHAAGIIHRGLKPGNIMVTGSGQVKVMDFGLADLAAKMPGSKKARPAEGKTMDARSDIFSLGAVLYEMASGKAALLRESPKSTVPPEVPAGLRAVIERCLTEDPAQRYQQAAEVRAALERVRDTSPVVAALARVERRTWLAGSGVAVFLLAALVWWVNRAGPPQLTDQRLLSTFDGEPRSASFSPDGGRIAFINTVNGVPQVWVRNLAQGNPIPLTPGGMPADQPRWSPKDDQIVFGSPGGIWSVAPSGGRPRRTIGDGRNPNFSGDGEQLVFERGNEIWLAKSDGSDAHRVDGVPEKFAGADSFPALSADGQWIAFFRPENGPAGDLWVIPAAGGQARQLTFAKAAGSSPVWTPEGRWIVYSSTRAEATTLWRVPSAGGTPEALTTGAGEDTAPALSADGRRLIFSNARKSWTLLLLDLNTHQQKEVLERREGILFPTFSPAGDRIAFFHSTPGGAQIFTVALDGTNVRQITGGKDEMNAMPRWSADGAFLYFYRMRPTPSFRKIPANRGTDIEVAPWSWDEHNGAQEDPTGRLLVYTLCERHNCTAAVVRELSTGKESRLALPLNDPRWSPDGTSVVGPLENRQIAICPVSGQACTTLTRGESPVWDPNGQKIYFMRVRATREQVFDLWSLDLKTRSEEQLVSLGPFLLIQAFFDVSKSRQVITAVRRQSRSELWLADVKR